MNAVLPPPNLLQHIANNPSQDDFVRSFEYLRDSIRDYLDKAGVDFDDFSDILDFGCGVGRFLFAFHEHIKPHQTLYGCDVYEPCATWCKQNIDFAEVIQNSMRPPLPYDSSKFDFVYALSVFTHLHLDMQMKWAWEVYRTLKPGGIFFATLHGPAFIPMFYESFRSRAKEAEFHSFDDGLFSLLSFHGREEDEGQVDVASAHTPDFASQQFSAFELLRRYPESRMAGGQDTYIFRKPLHGRTIERPQSAAGQSECCTWTSRMSAKSPAKTVELQFNLAGHDVFRVYPSLQEMGLFAAECEVEIVHENKTIAHRRIPFNRTRVFGKTHHTVIEIPLPPQTGPVSVRLGAHITTSGTLGDGAAEINWSFPNWT